jgi:N-acetylmuramoyl-L-alanine amidase
MMIFRLAPLTRTWRGPGLRLLALLVVPALLLAALPGAPALAQAGLRATEARLAGDARRTRLIVDLTGSLAIRAFALADPYRIVVDLPEIEFTLSQSAGQTGRGLVSQYRFGLMAPGKSRIVMDLVGPAVIDKAFVLDAADGQPARLVIDLAASDRDAFLAAIAEQRRAGLGPEEARPAAEPPPAAAAPGLPTVVIDPGHGGIDSGAVTPKGDEEKAIVLDFARRLAAKIEATGRYRAVLTRSDDSFVSLADRVSTARKNQAALFISIHADTLPDPFGVRGATVYTLSDTASDAESARYAEKENRADLIAGLDLSAQTDAVADILFDLTRRETKTFSNKFARVLTDRFKAAVTLNKNPRRSAGFWVLRAPDVPSVLLELGYLSNRQDAKLMLSDAWREQATDALVAAVDGFFAEGRSDPRDTSN